MLNENLELAHETPHPEPRRHTDRTELLNDVLDMMLLWHSHVTNSEGPAGLHAFLCASAPRYLSMIAHLRQRQRMISDRIEHLRRRVDHESAEPLGLEYEAIVHEIETHDALETDLLVDAIENG